MGKTGYLLRAPELYPSFCPEIKSEFIARKMYQLRK